MPFITSPGGSGSGGGTGFTPTATKTSAYPAAVGDWVVGDSSAGTFTVTLPAAPANGSEVTVENIGSANQVTVAAGAGDTINGTINTGATTARRCLVYVYRSSDKVWFGGTPLNTAVTGVSAGTGISLGGTATAPTVNATSYILGSSNAGFAHTGDTAETLLASVAIPANTIGAGSIEIVSAWSYTNSANNKVLRIRFGAANDLTGTQIMGITNTTTATFQNYTHLSNLTTASQTFFPGAASWNTSGTITGTAAIDTTAQTFVVFSVANANAGETTTLVNYLVRLIPAV